MQLVVNTFGAYVGKAGERFVVRAGDREQAVSAHKVASILIATGATLSTDAIQLAAAHNVDIVFLDKYGDPYGRVWQPRLGSITAIRHETHALANGLLGKNQALTVVETRSLWAEAAAPSAAEEPAADEEPTVPGVDCGEAGEGG